MTTRATLRAGVRVSVVDDGLLITTWRGSSRVRGAHLASIWADLEAELDRGCDLRALTAARTHDRTRPTMLGLLRHLNDAGGLVASSGQPRIDRAVDLVDMLGQDPPGQRALMRTTPIRIECRSGTAGWAQPLADAAARAGLRVTADARHRVLVTTNPLPELDGAATVAVSTGEQWVIAAVEAADRDRLAALMALLPETPPARRPVADPALVLTSIVATAGAMLARLPVPGALVVQGRGSRRLLLPVTADDLRGSTEGTGTPPYVDAGRDDVRALASLTSPPSQTAWWPWSPNPGRLPQGPLASAVSRDRIAVGGDQAGAGVGAFLDAVRFARAPEPGQLARAAGIGVPDALADLVAQIAVADAASRSGWRDYHGPLRPRTRRAGEHLRATAPVALEWLRRGYASLAVVRLHWRGATYYGCAADPVLAAGQAIHGGWAAELARRAGLPVTPPPPATPVTRSARDAADLLAAVLPSPAPPDAGRPDLVTAIGDLLGPQATVGVSTVGQQLDGSPVVLAIASRT